VDGDRGASLSNVQTDLIPFVALWKGIAKIIQWPFKLGQPSGWKKIARRDAEDGSTGQENEERQVDEDEGDYHEHQGPLVRIFLAFCAFNIAEMRTGW
jgi:hypothetical protein